MEIVLGVHARRACLGGKAGGVQGSNLLHCLFSLTVGSHAIKHAVCAASWGFCVPHCQPAAAAREPYGPAMVRFSRKVLAQLPRAGSGERRIPN